MSDLAVPTARDRVDAKACASVIIDEFRTGSRTPSSTLIGQATKLGLPLDALILLLAQLAMEAP